MLRYKTLVLVLGLTGEKKEKGKKTKEEKETTKLDGRRYCLECLAS